MLFKDTLVLFLVVMGNIGYLQSSSEISAEKQRVLFEWNQKKPLSMDENNDSSIFLRSLEGKDRKEQILMIVKRNAEILEKRSIEQKRKMEEANQKYQDSFSWGKSFAYAACGISPIEKINTAQLQEKIEEQKGMMKPVKGLSGRRKNIKTDLAELEEYCGNMKRIVRKANAIGRGNTISVIDDGLILTKRIILTKEHQSRVDLDAVKVGIPEKVQSKKCCC